MSTRRGPVPVVRLSEKRVSERLVMQMCCFCWEMVPVEHLWRCPHGVKWDACQVDGKREGCLCKTV